MTSAKFSCPECSRVFGRGVELGNHRRTHIKVKVEDLKCPECGFQAKLNNGLALHRFKMHGVLSANKMQEARKSLAVIPEQEKVHGVEKTERRPVIEAQVDTLAYAIAVGQVKEFCRHFAEEHDIPTREFTRRVAELFLREARR